MLQQDNIEVLRAQRSQLELEIQKYTGGKVYAQLIQQLAILQDRINKFEVYGYEVCSSRPLKDIISDFKSIYDSIIIDMQLLGEQIKNTKGYSYAQIIEQTKLYIKDSSDSRLRKLDILKQQLLIAQKNQLKTYYQVIRNVNYEPRYFGSNEWQIIPGIKVVSAKPLLAAKKIANRYIKTLSTEYQQDGQEVHVYIAQKQIKNGDKLKVHSYLCKRVKLEIPRQIVRVGDNTDTEHKYQIVIKKSK